ncbi:related to aldehyde dehydrogenase (NAD+), mitochondrial [Phialocephala subalpina]|uniref:aldehyde dehydrogenase (NAD(+)) n=1 Tax=Phialocephala subalpina TaxID=576137 RepID=A0A1L7XW21_9HELO|nr:related to aldehyde dehydrogenase (NAD+), mitochondrial [Phialocephala subalpina]
MAPSATSTNDHANSTTKLDFTTFSNVINGKLVPASDDATRHGINPATKKANPPVPVATKQDLDTAVEAGRVAFKKWAKTSVQERRDALLKFADALKAQQEEFAKLLTMEQGKPLMFARNEIDTAVVWLKGLANLDLPEEVIEDNEDRKVIIRYTPLGVVGAIVPWNFPVQLACGKIAPSVLTGNVIIVKPSPFTPYCDLKLVELAQQFFPPGVVQCLSGNDDLGPWITSHPGIDKISFTGSTFTGKKVMESASKTLKRVTLELGGNDPAIVCKSVDIATVAPKIATLGFLNSGQICLCVKRIYIHKDIYNEFRDAMVEYTKTLKVGDGTEDGVFLGPVQNEMQYGKVKAFFDDVEKNGMKVAVGGAFKESGGYFIQPTIIDGPEDSSKIVQEEPFGPIVPIMQWSDEDDVIARANDTKMGLGASVWSSDLDEAARIAKQLEAGSVWVNAHIEVSPIVPFGGHKHSGIGSEWGSSGLKHFCNSQSLYLKKKV